VKLPAQALACFAVREQMDKSKLRMPCVLAGVHCATSSPPQPEPSGSAAHSAHAPVTPTSPDSPAHASVSGGAGGGGGAGRGAAGGGEGSGSGGDEGLAAAAAFCARTGLVAPVACGGAEGYGRLYTAVADVCLRPRDSSPLLLKETTSVCSPRVYIVNCELSSEYLRGVWGVWCVVWYFIGNAHVGAHVCGCGVWGVGCGVMHNGFYSQYVLLRRRRVCVLFDLTDATFPLFL